MDIVKNTGKKLNNMEINEKELEKLGFKAHQEDDVTYYGLLLNKTSNLALITMDSEFKTVGLYPYEHTVQFTEVEEVQDVIRVFKDKTPDWNLIKNN